MNKRIQEPLLPPPYNCVSWSVVCENNEFLTTKLNNGDVRVLGQNSTGTKSRRQEGRKARGQALNVGLIYQSDKNTNDKKCAFTLAETLITLVIIGIVAALTVPLIMNKNQDIELKTRFKKSYSTMLKAFEKMNLDNGQSYECYYKKENGVIRDDCTKMFKNFAKQMNVIKYCENESLKNGCIPNYNVSKDYWAQYSGWLLNSPPSWVLGDGSILIGYGNNAYWPIFLVDINGMKGPNRPGYDVFSYYIHENAKGKIEVIPSGYIHSQENNTRRDTEWMLKEMVK